MALGRKPAAPLLGLLSEKQPPDPSAPTSCFLVRISVSPARPRFLPCDPVLAHPVVLLSHSKGHFVAPQLQPPGTLMLVVYFNKVSGILKVTSYVMCIVLSLILLPSDQTDTRKIIF